MVYSGPKGWNGHLPEGTGVWFGSVYGVYVVMEHHDLVVRGLAQVLSRAGELELGPL